MATSLFAWYCGAETPQEQIDFQAYLQDVEDGYKGSFEQWQDLFDDDGDLL